MELKYEDIYNLCPAMKNIKFEKLSLIFYGSNKKIPIQSIIDITDMNKPYSSGLYIYHLYSIIINEDRNINITGYRLARFLYDSLNQMTDKLERIDKWHYKVSEFKIIVDADLESLITRTNEKRIYESLSTGKPNKSSRDD